MSGTTTFDVSTETQLNQAIARADAATSGSFDIVFTNATITEGTDTGAPVDFAGQTLAAPPDLYAINLHSGVSLTIDGNGWTLDGANTYRGLFAYAGNVTIENLTIADAEAKGGSGGSGQFGGGGGGGLGGGLFVASGATVALDGVGFSGDSAVGGSGGAGGATDLGGGGGLGGPGGNGGVTNGKPGAGGGGGIGFDAAGGSGATLSGGAGIMLGAAGAGSGGPVVSLGAGGAGGGFGGGGGAGSGGGGGGISGGFGGQFMGGTASPGGGGSGGFGGGGGAGAGRMGGFGGGGGAGGSFGGGGGWGGGSGAGGNVANQSGYGGGAGGSGANAGGGGGLGAGGDIFIQQGGVLTIEGGSLSGGAVSGGGGKDGGGAGAALGSGIFVGGGDLGNATVTLAAPSGETLALADAIIDQSPGAVFGTPLGTVVVDGPGAVVASGTANITVSALTVGGGGDFELRGPTAFAPTLSVNAGGKIDGYGTIGFVTNDGSIIASGGTLAIPNGIFGGTGTLEVAVGSELSIANAPSSQSIVFSGADDVLEIDFPGANAAPILGFVTQDTIYLPTISDTNHRDTLAYSNGVLTVENSGTTLTTLDISGNYISSDFTIAPDPRGGSDLTTRHVPCFAAGTRIATPRGEVAVEDLRIGEPVLTAGGAERPIVWIGHRKLDCRRHSRPEVVIPVRVRAGAVAPGMPVRDLLLSPGHAVFADGVLIPVHRLINGASIVQENRAGTVDYYHVELAAHDVLLAQGLAVESYLDDGNRGEFENGGGASVLHPEFVTRDWNNACAPKREDGSEVAAVKRRLRERLLALGWQSSPGALTVMLGRKRLQPQFARGRLRHYLLPPGTAELRLLSPAGVPAWIDDGADDQRRLGAQLELLLLDGERIPLDDPVFATGFYDIERDAGESWRWTDGDARLHFPPAAAPRLLELLVRDVMRVWQAPQPRAALRTG